MEKRYIATHDLDDPNPMLIYPDVVQSSHGFFFLAGSTPLISRDTLEGLSQHVRELTPSEAAELDAIDKAIRVAQENRRTFLLRVFQEGRPVSELDMKGMVRK